MRGSISKVDRKNSRPGYWARIDVPSPDGQRKQKSKMFDTKREAEAWLAKMNHQMNTDVYIEPEKMTVAEFLRQWLEDYGR